MKSLYPKKNSQDLLTQNQEIPWFVYNHISPYIRLPEVLSWCNRYWGAARQFRLIILDP